MIRCVPVLPRLAATLATACLLTATGAATALPARAASPDVGSDFNGDGIADLAVASRDTIEGAEGAGAVYVAYGSTAGLIEAGAQRWVLADITGQAAPSGSDFGMALATGDFDGDGYDDLAVGAAVAVSDHPSAGAVYILYGSPAGLAAARAQTFTQDTPGVWGVAEDAERFGSVLTAGNFGKGAQDDLAIGTPDESVGDLEAAGSVSVFYGSADGLTVTGNQLLTQGPAFGQEAAAGNHFGAALAAADFGGSAEDDLAVGVPDQKVGSAAGAGIVDVWYGGTKGLSVADAQTWSQATPGVVGRVQPGDRFGISLAAGHFAGGDTADLAIGLEDRFNSGRGGVEVLYSRSAGLTATGSQLWRASTPGVPGAPGLDHFGATLAAGDFGRDDGTKRFDDLAIGVPLNGTARHPETGAVNILYGTSRGLGTAGAQYWLRSSAGVPGDMADHEQFGLGLAAADFGSTPRRDDLVIAAPFATHNGVEGAGEAVILVGAARGLTGAGARSLDPTLLGLADNGTRFGWRIAAN